MYTIVEIKGKQYKASEGDVLRVDYLGEEVKVYDDARVLLLSNDDSVKVGSPYLDDVKVSLNVLKDERGEKILAIRRKKKTHQMKKRGHRQDYSKVRVDKISLK